MWQKSDGTRSLNPDDLSEEDLNAFESFVHEIEDPEFRARVADVLWIRRKDFKAAKLAIPAFLESAERVKTDDLWPPYIDRLDRSAQIAGKKGFDAECKSVIDTVEAAIVEFENNPKSGLMCNRLMGILLMLREGDISRYAALSERLARDFQTTGEWHFAEAYWQIAESWHRRAKADGELQRCQIEAAECNILRAEEGLGEGSPQFGYSAHWMGRGLEGLRRAKADTARIKEIHTRFLALQKASLGELTPSDFDPDSIPGLKENRAQVQEAAVSHVGGLPFKRAILGFALIGKPTDVGTMTKNEKKNSEGIIWDKLFGANRLDRDGKIAEIMPTRGLAGDAPDQVAFRMKLCQTASMVTWPTAVEWRIEPARFTIAQEHSIRSKDLAFLVTNNPFIPQGHEGIYLRGIQAGFFGDWLVAMHLLIPQLEASLRHVLHQYGVVTSTLESDGTQKERDINQLLWDPKADEIFGQDILFDLRGILIERFGCNMRNELAHGLIYEAGFYRAEAVYLWWLAIHLCWIGFRSIPEELPDV
ncbi:MAG: DUF4209 domain-containing protein [Verrucomicrobiaceae bacterium]|nr:MAG: DUF4209 domain-containing protein [Verrucomicrobiaceae bacterium]